MGGLLSNILHHYSLEKKDCLTKMSKEKGRWDFSIRASLLYFAICIHLADQMFYRAGIGAKISTFAATNPPIADAENFAVVFSKNSFPCCAISSLVNLPSACDACFSVKPLCSPQQFLFFIPRPLLFLIFLSSLNKWVLVQSSSNSSFVVTTTFRD